jgi:hypothetical protein
MGDMISNCRLWGYYLRGKQATRPGENFRSKNPRDSLKIRAHKYA